MEQLKRLYENRRMLARKKVAEVRQKILKTGGGPPPKDDEDELVLSTMDPLTFKGLYNPFDSDSVTTININQIDQFEYVTELDKSEVSISYNLVQVTTCKVLGYSI
nr:unnamed protein product [Callosobruchus analis]